MADNRDTILELRGVNKTFKDFWLRPRVRAVRDMDLTVHRGEVIGLLGPNGSGKSTTIKMILGLLHPTSGQIAVLGKRPSDVQLKHRIGYLPEESHLYRFLNAEETLDFYARLFYIRKAERKGRVDALLEMVGLTAARYRPTGEYSKGMQRRVGLAQALINDPDLLILDEPTTGMDPIATRQIKDLILTLKARGKTILLCTHLLGEVEDVCDRLVIMYGGKVRAEGTVDELLRVEGRQALEVDGDAPLREETIRRLNTVLRDSEDRHIEQVVVPRQRLETLFLDVINRATSAGDATTGAAIGGEVAGFLARNDTAGGDDLLAQLAAPTRPAAVESEVARPTAGVSVNDLVQPDAAVLDEMAGPTAAADDGDDEAESPRPEAEAEPVTSATRGRAAQEQADDAFLSDLTGRHD